MNVTGEFPQSKKIFFLWEIWWPRWETMILVLSIWETYKLPNETWGDTTVEAKLLGTTTVKWMNCHEASWYSSNSFTALWRGNSPVVNKWITQMNFLRAEFPSLLQLFVFLVHVINGLFVAHNVLVITPSGAIFSVESVIMNSAYLKRSQPCPYNTKW